MAQLELLTVPALAARLVHSRHHLLALRMCQMMGLPTDQARTGRCQFIRTMLCLSLLRTPALCLHSSHGKLRHALRKRLHAAATAHSRPPPAPWQTQGAVFSPAQPVCAVAAITLTS